MSQEAARRALVKSSQQRADAATKSASALERIAQGIENGLRVLQSIDRYLLIIIFNLESRNNQNQEANDLLKIK